jgi:hypothetical protein
MTRLKDNFQAGDPVAALPSGWLNQVARWLNNLQCTNGMVTHNWGNLIITPFGNFGTAPSAVVAPWYCSKAGALTIAVQAGDIECGPDTVIAWASITDAATSVVIPSSQSAWAVWVEVDMSASPPSATMKDAATVTALTSTQKLTILQKRIATATITADDIDAVTPCQIGNIFLPRAAG